MVTNMIIQKLNIKDMVNLFALFVPNMVSSGRYQRFISTEVGAQNAD